MQMSSKGHIGMEEVTGGMDVQGGHHHLLVFLSHCCHGHLHHCFSHQCHPVHLSWEKVWLQTYPFQSAAAKMTWGCVGSGV